MTTGGYAKLLRREWFLSISVATSIAFICFGTRLLEGGGMRRLRRVMGVLFVLMAAGLLLAHL